MAMATASSGLMNTNNHENLTSQFITSSSSSEQSSAHDLEQAAKMTANDDAQVESGSGTKPKSTKKKSTLKIDIPRISSRDLHAQRTHSSVDELEQYGYVFHGPGSKRESNKLSVKLKTLELEECLKKAKKFAMEQSVRFALVKQQQQQQKQQLELIKKQQALLLMCRIYVGSIFYEVKEEAVRTAFGSFGPIRSISMSWDAATNKHKGFAFIEFETPEAAQLALEQMNGCLLGGRNIKVGRPSNMPQAQPIIDQLTEEAKNYNRIYLASVHNELSESDVQSVFEAFGTIKSCSLVRDAQTGKHKGYGFIEYETTQATQDAIGSMNMFDLGGQLLRVGKAVTPPENPTTTAQTNTLLSSVTTSGFDIKDLDKINLSSLTSVSQLSQFSSANAANAAAALASSSNSSSNLLASSSSSTTMNSSSSSSNLLSMSQTSTTTPLIVAPTQTTTTTLTSTTSSPAAAISIQMTQQEQATSKLATMSTNSPIAAASTTTQVTTNTATQKVVSTQLSPSGQQTTQNLTENQKKLLGMTNVDDPSASLEQQVEMTLKGKEQRLMLMQKLMQRKQESSRVLILRNMVGPEDVDEELESEITDECGKFGQVERVVIYQEKQGEEDDSEVIVKIFVEFVHGKSAEKAVEALNGRFFAGRVVKAEIYDQSAYDSKDYSI